MAATTTSANTPSRPESFVAHESNHPHTPTSLSPGSVAVQFATSNGGGITIDKSNHLHPQSNKTQTPDVSPKSAQARLSPARAAALTGAAAMAELKRRKQQQHQQGDADSGSRQTSPNPAVAAMQSLMGTGGMSKPTDAPAPDKMSEPLRKAAEKITVPDNANAEHEEQVSPVSLGSFGTLESTGTGNAMTATASEHHHNSASGQQFVAEPSDMNDAGTYHDSNGNLTVPDQDSSKAVSYSYPGPPPQQNDHQGQEGGPARGMSLPGYGRSSPKSPASNKRHKCPYCSTDFTRHHNLKSHLLTHSQEKPYVCQTCQARFRRLHDLKRHTKLHTGERPHTCDKCGRKFARGDALARHNKGPGGCAGRRSSFGGDDEFPEGMEGVEYDEGDEGSDDQGRRGSEPNRKRQHLESPQDPSRQVYRQHSSTYPPAPAGGVLRGNMGPPQVIHPGSNSATSPRDASGQPSPAGGPSANSSYYGSGQLFAEPGMMTHSPKPLSPGQAPDQQRLSIGEQGGLGRNRSTSLTTQFQQQHFGRQSGGRTPPQPNTPFASNAGQPHNILPPLGSSNQSQNRGGMQAALPGQAVPNIITHGQSQMPANQSSNPGSHSSHGRSSGSSMRDITQNPDGLWDYVRNLESRFSRMQDEYELRISRLQEEVISLKGQIGQLSNVPSYSSDMGRQGPYP